LRTGVSLFRQYSQLSPRLVEVIKLCSMAVERCDKPSAAVSPWYSSTTWASSDEALASEGGATSNLPLFPLVHDPKHFDPHHPSSNRQPTIIRIPIYFGISYSLMLSLHNDRTAQLVVHRADNQKVGGSIPYPCIFFRSFLANLHVFFSALKPTARRESRPRGLAGSKNRPRGLADSRLMESTIYCPSVSS